MQTQGRGTAVAATGGRGLGFSAHGLPRPSVAATAASAVESTGDRLNRRAFLAACAAVGAATLARAAGVAPVPAPRTRRFGDARDWFFEKRFGMFVHWGIYAAGAWHEQHQYRRKLGRAEYAKLVPQFNPVKFDPDAWLDVAEAAGMGYVTFTAKHVDGFCMWDSKRTDFKVTRTPYAKDTLAMLADACHRRKMPLCVYYSLADMNHPNYPSAGRPYELPAPEPGDAPDLAKYLDYVKAQVRELCTNYGEIHGFWWDANVLKHRDPSINDMIRKLQPAAVINNRGCDDGDFGTPERDWDASVNTKTVFDTPVEACQSVGYQSWGWREDEDYYSDTHLVRSIHKVLAKGGNYLLNVGPKPDGTIADEQAAILRRLGVWLQPLRASLFDVEPAGDLTTNRDVVLTRRGATVYVHLVKDPETASVFLHPLAVAPRRATLLGTGEPVAFDVADLPRLHNATPNRCLRLKNLPVNERWAVGWVIALEFDSVPAAASAAPRKEETK